MTLRANCGASTVRLLDLRVDSSRVSRSFGLVAGVTASFAEIRVVDRRAFRAFRTTRMAVGAIELSVDRIRKDTGDFVWGLRFAERRWVRYA